MYKLFIITFLLAATASADEFYKYHCVNTAPDIPKIKFRGNTHYDTFEKVVKLCLSFRQQQFLASRNRAPETERTIIFLDHCVNSTYCVEQGKELNKNEYPN